MTTGHCLTGIIFVLKSGIPWEMLPQEMGCGSGMTCWRRLRYWHRRGVWKKLLHRPSRPARSRGTSRRSKAVVDSQIFRPGFWGPSPAITHGQGQKLGRQSLIDEGVLKRSEVGDGSRRKRRPSVRTACRRSSEPRRSRQADRSDGHQVRRLDRPQPRRGRRHQPHRAPHHRPRAGHLPAAAPPLVVAVRAEELLQVVVRPRQARARRSTRNSPGQ